MFSVQEDEVDEVSDSLKENVIPQPVKYSDSSSLKNNSNSTAPFYVFCEWLWNK